MHLAGMLIEVGFERGHIALAHLAQHPTHSFVNQVVRMRQKDGGKAQSVVILVGTYQHPARDHGDALFPEVGACSKAIEHLAVGHRTIGLWVQKPWTKNLWA